jgi:carbonic anhydrase/acetyltransferase-like protein (isoleucine patch superfamily)
VECLSLITASLCDTNTPAPDAARSYTATLTTLTTAGSSCTLFFIIHYEALPSSLCVNVHQRDASFPFFYGFSFVVLSQLTIVCRSGPTGLPAATFIGEAVTVGAGSLLRSCRIHEQTVIGERCIIMEGSVVDGMSVLLPGTVVPPAKYIPSGEVWGGSPARFIRKLTHDEVRTSYLCFLADATLYRCCFQRNPMPCSGN